MTRLAASILAFLVACSLTVADTPKSNPAVEGTIVKVDRSQKSITVKTADGTKTIAVGKDTQFFLRGAEAASNGLNNDQLAPGVNVRIVMASNSRSAKEIRIAPIPKDGSSSTEIRPKRAPDAADTSKPDAKTEGEVAREIASHMLRGTVIKVDQERKVITLEVAGIQTDYTVDDSTQFIGPHGGTASKGMTDVRLVKGARLSLAANGKTVKEVYLPFRK